MKTSVKNFIFTAIIAFGFAFIGAFVANWITNSIINDFDSTYVESTVDRYLKTKHISIPVNDVTARLFDVEITYYDEYDNIIPEKLKSDVRRMLSQYNLEHIGSNVGDACKISDELKYLSDTYHITKIWIGNAQ